MPRTATCRYCNTGDLRWECSQHRHSAGQTQVQQTCSANHRWALRLYYRSGDYMDQMHDCPNRPQSHGTTAALDGAPKGDPMRGQNGTATMAPFIPAIIGNLEQSDIDAETESTMQPIIDLDAAYAELEALDAQDAEAAVAAAVTLTAPAPAPAPMPAPVHDAHSASRIPAIDGAYLVDTTAWRILAGVIADADAGTPQNLGLYGEAGSGKTTLAVQIAAIRKAPLFVFESAGKETPADCWGESRGLDPQTGLMRYDPSPLITGLETPYSVVLLNDLALLASHSVQNGLNDALDPSMRRFYVPQLGRDCVVASGVLIIGTWNVASSRYSSARPLAAQILDRFASGAMFEVPYPSNGALEKIIMARSGIDKANAKRLALVADWLRNDPQPIPCGTRALIAAARRMLRGSAIGEALWYTVLGDPNIDDRTRTRAYGILNVESGKKTPEDQPLYVVPQTGTYALLSELADA